MGQVSMTRWLSGWVDLHLSFAFLDGSRSIALLKSIVVSCVFQVPTEIYKQTSRISFTRLKIKES